MKRWAAILLTASLALSAGAVNAYAAVPGCYQYCDEDNDGYCDNCSRQHDWCSSTQGCGGHHGGHHRGNGRGFGGCHR